MQTIINFVRAFLEKRIFFKRYFGEREINDFFVHIKIKSVTNFNGEKLFGSAEIKSFFVTSLRARARADQYSPGVISDEFAYNRVFTAIALDAYYKATGSRIDSTRVRVTYPVYTEGSLHVDFVYSILQSGMTAVGIWEFLQILKIDLAAEIRSITRGKVKVKVTSKNYKIFRKGERKAFLKLKKTFVRYATLLAIFILAVMYDSYNDRKEEERVLKVLELMSRSQANPIQKDSVVNAMIKIIQNHETRFDRVLDSINSTFATPQHRKAEVIPDRR